MVRWIISWGLLIFPNKFLYFFLLRFSDSYFIFNDVLILCCSQKTKFQFLADPEYYVTGSFCCCGFMFKPWCCYTQVTFTVRLLYIFNSCDRLYHGLYRVVLKLNYFLVYDRLTRYVISERFIMLLALREQ